ncbi:MAG TPA: patatin-like phospholipase family protein [Chitinophaga sp.]|uniref:patatin-like phospholipase family protein n=1 Tax=Chitinophaga sp. TaxID=1869181 RepID=UPI002C5B3048|nr:patatin-like phospholipase family protein [Chitinophaga sp.]HVI46431.1 patatin-like phospholipase family protein [Chitinophaga sp.]
MTKRVLLDKAVRFLSHLLRSVWLFFPGIMFLIFIYYITWNLDQGKDIIVAFTENEYAARIVFFIAIAFWVYVSWYSSRIISYIKKFRQIADLQVTAPFDSAQATLAFERQNVYFSISQPFLEEFPRSIGNGCFLLLELAMLQSPALRTPFSTLTAWIVLFIAAAGLYLLNRALTKWARRPFFRKLFYILLFSWIVLTAITSFIPRLSVIDLLLLLIWLHAVFLMYIHLRRVEIEERIVSKAFTPPTHTFFDRVMDYFCIPREEKGYLGWFIFVGFIAFIFYVAAIQDLRFARQAGPLSYLLLAFGMLLLFGNVVTAFSVRYRISIHFLFIVAALVIGLKETHYVKTLTLPDHDNRYASRPSLETYLRAWLHSHPIPADSTYDVYFVMANGGASRSAYWTASVLGRIEDSTIRLNSNNRFSKHLFCLSGTSGGGVGVASFFAMLRDQTHQEPKYSRSAMKYLRQDYFSYTFARMLGPDFFHYIAPIYRSADRSAALEQSFERSADVAGDSLYRIPMDAAMSSFPAINGDTAVMPILFINTTRMQDGNPGVVTNLRLDSGIFNNRIDVLQLLPRDSDITITTAAILGARFPYLSPAGRIQDQYFVDGGYFDNSGAGAVQEIIRGIISIGEADRHKNGDSSALYRQINRLNFKVLHITNSPVIPKPGNFESVAPVKNDLLAPILTIMGAYDMQTTVNDIRLLHYINDLAVYSHRSASYVQIPLYKDSIDWRRDPLWERFHEKGEPSYTMNWFMSDTTIRRINQRLSSNRMIDTVIARMGK